MTRSRGDSDLRVRGTGLRRKFVLAMTAALSLVVLGAAILLYSATSRIEGTILDKVLRDSVRLSDRAPKLVVGDGRKDTEGVEVFEVTYGDPLQRAELYRYQGPDRTQPPFELFVPEQDPESGKALLQIIAVTMVLIVVVGAGVALWIAQQVTRPIHMIIDDVRQISFGELDKRIRVSGGGEIELLARSIERMTGDLESAQEAKLELSIRERELELATDVREALLPMATPMVQGYDVGAIHISSPRIGGDFHDYVELEGGRVALLVCDVGGQGMPAALIGATARSYLRSELIRVLADDVPSELLAAMCRVNRWVGDDVERGVFVSALCALIDPARAQASVVCAGHRIPLIRYAAAEGVLRQVHPEGIALGLDKGPVFERRLEVQEIPIEVGDRLLLCNSGPVRLENTDGQELGEKRFYARVLKHAGLESLAFLKALRKDLEQFASEGGIPHDISLVTISREA